MPRHPTPLESSFREDSKISKVFDIFLKILHFSQIFENLGPQWRGNGIVIFTFEHIDIDLHHTLDKVFCALFLTLYIKTLITR